MYAGTTFKLYDESYIDRVAETVDIDEKTLFFVMTTADKGSEKLTRIYGKNFYKMFGNKLSFEKHGQALLQAKKIVDAGGELLIKRFVANDATLSNAIILAKVTPNTVYATNEQGEQLYVDATNGETTTSATTSDGTQNEKLIDTDKSGAIVKFEVAYKEGAKSYADVEQYALTLNNEEPEDGQPFVYPLIIATDIGRNADIKRLSIRPDYDTSKSLEFMMYNFVDYEGTTNEETVAITMNPDILYKGKSYAINQHSMSQFNLGTINNAYEKYVKKLSDITGIDFDELKNMDLIYCKNRKGIDIHNITVDKEGADIGYIYGIQLQGGSDGTEFGDTPKTSANLETAMISFLKGNETDEIYDVDVHKIAIIPDANYPIPVKEAIAEFVNFREDCFFVRDLGTGITTFAQIMAVKDKLTSSRYIADYLTTYQVYDPYTDKRIEVTMIYGMIEPLIQHFQSGAARPIAGEINGFTISEAIEGTVNYIPRNTPTANQKDELDDARINYATYYEYGGNLVVDSLYTSQEAYTQLSYANNMIAIQEIMRVVRTQCPKNRFTFISGNDFSEYKKAVNDILANYKSRFSTLEMVYEEDPLKASQKIFYAVIKFSFNNWAQSESFDLYAINTESDEE